MTSPSTLLINRGDLPSLAAAITLADPASAVFWHFVEPDRAASRRREIAERLADTLSAGQCVISSADSTGLEGMAPPVGIGQAQLVLSAAAVAMQLECPRIIWPHQVGPEADAVTEVVDRANLVIELIEIGQRKQQLTIDLPLVDLTDAQVAEIADDAGAPMELFWPCEGCGSEPCLACPECERWQAAFGQSGLPWPWAVAAA